MAGFDPLNPPAPDPNSEPLRYFPEKSAEVAAAVEAGVRVRKVFVDMFQTIFGQDQIFPGVDNIYRWVPEGTQSKILIASDFVEEQAVKNPNHSIIVNRSDINYPRMHLNNSIQPHWVGSDEKFGVLGACNISLVVESILPAETEKLANIVAFSILSYRDLIRRKASFHTVGNPAVGAIVPVQAQDAKIKRTRVTVSFLVEWPLVWVFSSKLRQELTQVISLTTLDC